MNNDRIIILDDSVILKHNWINDDDWEVVIAFPRNGLTYQLQNNGIRFFAYQDYFYRNCVLSMEFPLHITDEENGIDGDYSDIAELTELLDRIFFVGSEKDIDLSTYLKKREAEELYQPIGDYLTGIPENYVTDEDLNDVLEDYLTKEEAEETYQPIGDYLSGNALSGYATEQWVEDKGYLTEHQPLKTINGQSLSGQGNIQIDCSGGTVDAYTKEEADERFQPKGEYVTSATFITYITNLQEQIDSIIQSVSGCCSSSGETIYRWITLTGEDDYICNDTVKYSKQQKQQSTDNGMTWTNVSPAVYQRGSIIEYDSEDCGYTSITPVITSVEYQTKNIGDTSWPITIVATGDLSRITFSHTSPKTYVTVDENTGELHFSNKCKLVNSYSSYSVYTINVKIDGTTVSSVTTPYIQKTETGSGTTCQGYDKVRLDPIYFSFDNGTTWCPANKENRVLIEANSVDCGYTGETTIEYRWVVVSGDYICEGYNKYQKLKEQSSTNGGSWIDTGNTKKGNLIEANSEDCGYSPSTTVATSTLTYKVTSGERTEIIHSSVSASTLEVQLSEGTYTSIDVNDGNKKDATFNYTSNNALGRVGHKTNWLSHSMFWNVPLTSINVGEGIVYIDDQALTRCDHLTSITLPSTITGWTSNAIANNSALTTVIVNSTTPPTIANETLSIYLFTGCPNLTAIKVPASAVDTFKNNTSWSRYASIIQGI